MTIYARPTLRRCAILVLALLPTTALGHDVLTNRYNNARTGATTTRNLDASTFRSGAWHRLGALPVEGQVYAQPLYVEGLHMQDGRRHDVVFIVTSLNKVYAFDAQVPSAKPLWGPTKLGDADTSLIGDPNSPCNWLSQARIDKPPMRVIQVIGNQATPVIDRATGKMYVTFRTIGGRERLAAIDIRTGAKVRAPVDVSAPGFDPVWHRSRASLLLFQGVVYAAYGSRCEEKPTLFHGWVFGFDPNDLRRLTSYQVTPPGLDLLGRKHEVDGGGIWQGSSGLAADQDSIYLISGNRRPGADGLPRALETVANSVVRLAPGKDFSLTAVDWFTPYRRVWMDETDLDLGSAGPVIVPNSRYLIAGGKQGLLYVIDRANMGKFDTAHAWDDAKWHDVRHDATSFDWPEDFSADHVVQKLRVGFNQFIPDDPAYLAVPGGSVGAAKQDDDQLDVFNVGRDGAIYVTWERGDGLWSDGGTEAGYKPRPLPARITPPGVAPLNATVIAAKQTPDQLDAFWVGNDGAIWVTWVVGTDPWHPSPARITPAGFAKPGACVAAARQNDNQLDVFVVRGDGAVWVTWVVEKGLWSAPARITPTGYAIPGRCVTAAKQTDNQLDVLFVGGDGAVYVTWVVGTDPWHPFPAQITRTRLAPAGAHVTAAKQTADQLDAFVVGNDGAVYVAWVVGSGKWCDVTPPQPCPAPITPTNSAPKGAPLAASEQVPGQLDVLFVDNHGAMRVIWVVGTERWSGPRQITDNRFPAGARLAAIKQNTNLLNAFAVAHDGAIHMTWVERADAWVKPVRLSRALWMSDWAAWPHIHGTPVFASFPDGSATLYLWPEKDHLKSFPWTGSRLSQAGKKLAVGLDGDLALAPDGMPGGMLAVSVDPTKRRAGILFAALSRNQETNGPGILRAYDATSLQELWNNGEERYIFSKFVPPTIAGGKVFLPTGSNKVIVYGQ